MFRGCLWLFKGFTALSSPGFTLGIWKSGFGCIGEHFWVSKIILRARLKFGAAALNSAAAPVRFRVL